MKYRGLDWLKGIAAIFIVGCHVTLSPRTPAAEWTTHFCNTFVGVFAAVSGFLLSASLEKKRGMGGEIARRFRRLLPIYVFWSVFYVFFSLSLCLFEHNPGKIERLKDIHYWISVLFQGGASCHLWYIASLFYGSILVVLLNAVSPILMRNGVLLLCLGGTITMLSTCFGKAHWAIYDLRLLGFVLTGCAIYGMKGKSVVVYLQSRQLILWVILALALALHCVLDSFLPRFVRDWFVVVPILLLAARASLRNAGEKFSNGRCYSLLEYSLGIYLWHPLLAAFACRFVSRFFSSPFGVCPLLLCWIGVWIGAVFLTGISRRIPFFKGFV